MTTSKLTLTLLCAAGAVFSATRFDYEVRNDYFAGFGGDAAALERAMIKTSAVLAAEPNHAEAMVWHGAGIFFQSGQAFRNGDQQKGMDLFTKGVAMMDKAVELAPDHIGVRIPRGAVLLQASLMMPEQIAKPLIEKGLSDYARCYELQKAEMDRMGEHPKGELLFGIADAHRRLGNDAKAEEFFQMIAKAMPGSNYAKRADIWLTTKTLKPAQVRCAGCHTGAGK
jgi:hypothetical protein